MSVSAEDWDAELIIRLIALSACVLLVAGGAYWLYEEHKDNTRGVECENNPRLLYEQKCNGREDCMKQCKEQLSRGEA